MSDYLKTLVAKNLELTEVIQPRLTSRFEPSFVERNLMPPLGTAERDTRETESYRDNEARNLAEQVQDDDRELLSSRRRKHARTESSVPFAPIRKGVTHAFDDAYDIHHQADSLRRSRIVGMAEQTFNNTELRQIETDARAAPVDTRQAANTRVSTTIPVAVGADVLRPSVPDTQGGEQQGLRVDSNEVAELPNRKLHIVTPTLTPVSPLLAAQQELPQPTVPAPQVTPTIKVTIGRINVRAVMQSAPMPRPTPVRPNPRLSLEDYLKQRNGGRR